MFSIGEFSLITRLSVKTLRYYHEEGLLVPDYIDNETGYRYYREQSFEKVIVITMFREMNFSITDIKDIFSLFTDDIEVMDSLLAQKNKIEGAIHRYRKIHTSLEQLIQQIRSNEMDLKNNNYDVEEKNLEDIIFAGIRYNGKYGDMGRFFTLVGKKVGRYIAGRPMALYYDGEYRENDADIEPGFPVLKSISDNEIACRVLPGGKALTIIHRGAYKTLGNSYRKILSCLEEKKLNMKLPTRELYLKGPGIIFKGKPDNYLTEIQIPVN